MQAIVAEVDTDGSGEIDFDEFLVMMANKMGEQSMEEEIMDAFKLFDEDGSGSITLNELRNSMSKFGEHLIPSGTQPPSHLQAVLSSQAPSVAARAHDCTLILHRYDSCQVQGQGQTGVVLLTVGGLARCTSHARVLACTLM